MKRLLMVLLLLWSGPAWADTHAAASCSRDAVAAAIAAASDGDTVTIPAGSCTWTSGITVTAGIGITITGAGTPNNTPSTIGASASCSQTIITIGGFSGSPYWGFSATPSYGASTMRVSCMKILPSGVNQVPMLRMLGTCTASGCPSLRIDNLTLLNWENYIAYNPPYWQNSAAITAIGDMFGVIDHVTYTNTGLPSGSPQLIELSHASYMGVGDSGDNAWAQPEDYGTAKFLYLENNLFTNTYTFDNEGSAGGPSNYGGTRAVVRYNTFAAMTSGAAMGWHGTESSGRVRGGRAFEYYGNVYTCASGSACNTVVGVRSGTGLAWGNTVHHAGASINELVDLGNYRSHQSFSPWGPCDGSSVWDTNDGVTYYSGTIQSVSGSNPYTITVNGSPGWTTNQWVVNGSPYSMHDATINNGAEISGNSANTITVGAWTSVAYAAGDAITILRATACLDQTARGAGRLYSSYPPTPELPANQVRSPTYVWSNTINDGAPGSGVEGVYTDTRRVIRNRDFYVENLGQGAQTSSSSPFDGTTTIGLGHGTLANRPATCTAGVGYWATDQGSWNQSGSGEQGIFYLCTATNTWTLAYTPYAYPHPVIGGATPSLPSAPTNVRIR